MNSKEIFNDAENLIINKKNQLISIGGKITKIPDYQYMGIICLTNDTFKKLRKYFKTLNKKIDFTSFLNLVVQNRVSNFKVVKTNKFWTEVDTEKDILAANKIIKGKMNKLS